MGFGDLWIYQIFGKFLFPFPLFLRVKLVAYFFWFRGNESTTQGIPRLYINWLPSLWPTNTRGDQIEREVRCRLEHSQADCAGTDGVQTAISRCIRQDRKASIRPIRDWPVILTSGTHKRSEPDINRILYIRSSQTSTKGIHWIIGSLMSRNILKSCSDQGLPSYVSSPINNPIDISPKSSLYPETSGSLLNDSYRMQHGTLEYVMLTASKTESLTSTLYCSSFWIFLLLLTERIPERRKHIISSFSHSTSRIEETAFQHNEFNFERVSLAEEKRYTEVAPIL